MRPPDSDSESGGPQSGDRSAGAREEHEHLGFSASVAPGPDGRSVVVTIIGELDASASQTLARAFEQANDQGGQIELDMRACSFIDSTGVATLVMEARRLHERGEPLKIRGARERVRRILELAGLVSQGWVLLESG